MQKLEEKVEEWDSLLSAQDRPSTSPHSVASAILAWRRATKKPQGAVSTNLTLSAWSPPYPLCLEGPLSTRSHEF